jgi:hypothetical protein
MLLSAGRATQRSIVLVGLFAIVAFTGWLLLRQNKIPRSGTTLTSISAKVDAPSSIAAKAENISVVSPDRPKTNDEFAREVEELLAGPRMNAIPKIAQAARRWAALDPEATLRFFEKLPPQEGQRRRAPSQAALEEWLKVDVTAAVAFAKAAVWRDAANAHYLDLIFKTQVGAGNAEPYAELKRYLDELPQIEPVFSQVLHAIGPELKNNLRAAEAFAEKFPAGESRDGLHTMLGMAKAQVMGFAALEALAAKAELSSDERLQLSGVVSRLSRETPNELGKWLETQPVDPGFDYARVRLAVDVYMTDPEKALRIARQLSNEQNRRRHEGLFLESWLRKDFAAAETWATASDLPAELVVEQITKVTAPKILVDYATKLNATLEIADDRMKRREQFVVQKWLRQDRAAALAWIKANAKTEADQQFFSGMIESVPEQTSPGPAIILH